MLSEWEHPSDALFTPRFTQGVTPLHQDADRYLQEMGFEDVMERAVSSDAQTPPLATNPLSYLAM